MFSPAVPKSWSNSRLMMVVWSFLLGGASVSAFGQSHSYLNTMRSSTRSHVFVQQSVEGEYGDFVTAGSREGQGAFSERQTWKGYGIGTVAGIELMKFIQFYGGHTFVNMRRSDDVLETLSGSRLTAGIRLVFLAPLANLEAGGGVIGSRLDYRKQLDHASFYGSGAFYTLGLNHFLSSQVSVYLSAKMSREHLVRSSGSSSVQDVKSDTSLMGLGFRIWI